MKAALLALSVMLAAPFQCGTEPNERPREDSAPKALWMLAEKFETQGNAPARETTLEQLVEVYPSSRYAERARQALVLPSRQNSAGPAASESEGESSGSEDPESGDE